MTGITPKHEGGHKGFSKRVGYLQPQKEGSMFSVPHLIYGLAGFYGLVGVVVFRLARKPSCRNCLNRSHCPNRPGGLSEVTQVPKCVASKENEPDASSV